MCTQLLCNIFVEIDEPQLERCWVIRPNLGCTCTSSQSLRYDQYARVHSERTIKFAKGQCSSAMLHNAWGTLKSCDSTEPLRQSTGDFQQLARLTTHPVLWLEMRKHRSTSVFGHEGKRGNDIKAQLV